MTTLNDKIAFMSLLDDLMNGWEENHSLTEHEVVFDVFISPSFIVRVYSGLGKFTRIDNNGRRVVKICCVLSQTGEEFKYIEFDMTEKKMRRALLVCVQTVTDLKKCPVCGVGWMIPKNGKNGPFSKCSNYGEYCTNKVNVDERIGVITMGSQ